MIGDGVTTAKYAPAASSPEQLLLAARSSGSSLLHCAAPHFGMSLFALRLAMIEEGGLSQA